MKEKPLISILVPCYNAETYLQQCLDSIIGQTYSNLQIVLIDDGSLDNTWNILNGYAERDSRIEIYHQDNHGVAYTRNQLLDKIKGEYFLFIDSDDWIECDMVEFLLCRAQENGADMVVSGVVKNDTNPASTYTEEFWYWKTAIEEFLKHVNFSGSLWNKLSRVTLLNKHPRFNCEISYGEDALFCWELLKEARSIVVTDRQLYHYRMNAASLSHLKWTPEKKGSGSITWKLISEDASKLFPQYADIVNARYAIEDMWGLYYAAIANYPHDAEITKRQKHVRESFQLIRRSGLVSRNKLVFAWIISRWYGFGWCLRVLRIIKGQDKNIGILQ